MWNTPSFEKQMSPMALHRTYGQCHADVLAIDWSPDSQFLAVASKDITARYAWAWQLHFLGCNSQVCMGMAVASKETARYAWAWQ